MNLENWRPPYISALTLYLCRMSDNQITCSDSEDDECHAPTLSDCLFQATLDGNATELRRLINLGYDVNTSDRAWTCTHAAAVFNQPECLKLLLSAGGQVNSVCSSAFKGTPLVHALKNRNAECALILIEHGADVNANSCQNESVLALSMQIPSCVDIDLIKNLLRHGLNVRPILIDKDVLPFIPESETEKRTLFIDWLEAAGAISYERFIENRKALREIKRPERLEKQTVEVIRLELKINRKSNLFLLAPKTGLPIGIRKMLTYGLKLD